MWIWRLLSSNAVMRCSRERCLSLLLLITAKQSCCSNTETIPTTPCEWAVGSSGEKKWAEQAAELTELYLHDGKQSVKWRKKRQAQRDEQRLSAGEFSTPETLLHGLVCSTSHRRSSLSSYRQLLQNRPFLNHQQLFIMLLRYMKVIIHQLKPAASETTEALKTFSLFKFS